MSPTRSSPAQGTVLLVEDEPVLAKNIQIYLQRHGFAVTAVGSAEQALAEAERLRPDVVLLDHMLPGATGLDTVAPLAAAAPAARIVMLTGHGSIDMAVEAMKRGAADFLTKPVALAKLREVVERLVGTGLASVDDDATAALIGQSPAMRELRELLARIVHAERTMAGGHPPAVLITGETGTGKQLAARALHEAGPRAAGPFVEIDCSATPASMLESDLFGHERVSGGGRDWRMGLIEAADGGTLFFDEIGDLDIGLQGKLLKLLEDKAVRRMGSASDRRVDVRFIAATHQSLEELVRVGRFRRDLFFRLHTLQVPLPPLRERHGDVEALAQHFLRAFAERYGKTALRLSHAALAALQRHPWPGNVRELRNAIEQAVLLSTSERIEPGDLRLIEPSRIAPAASAAAPGAPVAAGPAASGTLGTPGVGLQSGTLPGTAALAGGASGLGAPLGGAAAAPSGSKLDQVERELIERALAEAHGNVSLAARALGISRDTLRYRLDKHGLNR